MSILEIAIIAVIAAAVFFALRRIVRMRKSGGGCGCSGCCAECGGGCGMSRKGAAVSGSAHDPKDQTAD